MQHSVERLAVHVKEGIPLTPAKYARDARIAAVDSLKRRVEEAKWITPELLDEYTALYVKDLEIGGSTEYFFAKIPVSRPFWYPRDEVGRVLDEGQLGRVLPYG